MKTAATLRKVAYKSRPYGKSRPDPSFIPNLNLLRNTPYEHFQPQSWYLKEHIYVFESLLELKSGEYAGYPPNVAKHSTIAVNYWLNMFPNSYIELRIIELKSKHYVFVTKLTIITAVYYYIIFTLQIK